MELYDNIVEHRPEEDYNDFVSRRRNNKKSIRTKVTTLKDNGEVVSEILGTNDDESSSFDGNEQKSEVEVESNFTNSTDDNTVVKVEQKETTKIDTKKEVEQKDKNNNINKVIEDKTVFGMKPVYGYTVFAVIALVGIAATVKILKNNKLNKIKLK